MKKSKNNTGLLFLLLAILFALGAAYLGVQTVKAFNKEVIVTVPKENIPNYTFMTEDMFTTAVIPQNAILGKVLSKDELIGKYAISVLIKGHPIYPEQVSKWIGGEITQKLNQSKRLDMVSISIPVDHITGGFGGKITPGDRISIIAFESNQTIEIGTYLLVTNVINENNGKTSGLIIEVNKNEAKTILPYIKTGNYTVMINPQFG